MFERLLRPLRALYAFLTLPTRTWQALHRLIVEGGLTVETVFSYTPSAGDKTYQGRFHSSLHPGGQIVNLVPDPNLLGRDPAWLALIQQQAPLHFAKITALVTDLQQVQQATQHGLTVVGGGAGLLGAALLDEQYPLAHTLNQMLLDAYSMPPFLVNLLWFVVLGGIGGFLFRYLLRGLLFHWLSRKIRRLLQ